MAVADDIRMALHDAIGWQLGLADAYPAGSLERREALDTVKRYRAILRRRYGSDVTALDEALGRATLVDVLSLK